MLSHIYRLQYAVFTNKNVAQSVKLADIPKVVVMAFIRENVNESLFNGDTDAAKEIRKRSRKAWHKSVNNVL